MTSFSRIFLMLSMASLFTACLPKQEALTSQEKDDPSSTPSQPMDPSSSDPAQQKAVLTGVTQVFGDRGFVRSTLENVFLNSSSTAGQKTTFYSTLDTTLNSAVPEFGGALNLYSTRGLKEFPAAGVSTNGAMTNDSMAEVAATTSVSPARISMMNEICRKLMNVNDDYLLAALANAGIRNPTTTAPSGDGIRSLYLMFSPGREIDSAIIGANLEVDAALIVKNPSISIIERWRATVYLSCSNPYWQAL